MITLYISYNIIYINCIFANEMCRVWSGFCLRQGCVQVAFRRGAQEMTKPIYCPLCDKATFPEEPQFKWTKKKVKKYMKGVKAK